MTPGPAHYWRGKVNGGCFLVRDAEQSKKKILAVAEKVFAQKGFDGARVDEIAKKAGVNKALLYYYFKSKKQILEEIIGQFVDVFINSLARYADNVEALMNVDEINLLFKEILPFLEEKRDILRIIVAESLKSSDDDPILFKVMELRFSDEIENTIQKLRDKGFQIDEQIGQMLVTEFFTGLMPVINFVIYADKWAKHFNVDPEDLKKWFITAYEDTHVAHHQSDIEKIAKIVKE